MTIQLHINYPRGSELYIYRFARSERRNVLAVIGRQCLRPDLSLDWRDALQLERKIRGICDIADLFAACDQGASLCKLEQKLDRHDNMEVKKKCSSWIGKLIKRLWSVVVW